MILKNLSLHCCGVAVYRSGVQQLTLMVAGILTGWALIAAIGAQNAYVLRQGLRREHVLPVIAVCIVSDVVLIGAAVGGVGLALQRWPGLLPVATWAGGLFVIGYGITAAWRAWRGGAGLRAAGGESGSARRAVLTVAALTWLNPHLYVDIMMLGTVANGHGPEGRWWFYAGLVAASTSWFVGLGYGAGRLGRLFRRPSAWRALDAGIAASMMGLGTALLLHA